jgi:sulfate adenylyltransferase subunit 1
MNQKSLQNRTKLIVKHTTKECQAMVKDIQYKVDVNTLHRIEDIHEIGMNDIARVSIRTASPIFFDSYSKNRQTGSIILIDPNTNETVGAGMII